MVDEDGFELPVGRYTLPDGREVVGLSDFELRAVARDGWRRQAMADAALEAKLKRLRSELGGSSSVPAPVIQGEGGQASLF